MRTSEWIMFVIVVAAFAVASVIYPQLPATVPAHWNLQGVPDGSMSGFWAAFIAPIVMAFVALLLFLVPRIDPKRDNIAKFRKYYGYLSIGILVILFWIFLLIPLLDLGYQFNLVLAIIPALAGLFWLIGSFLPHTEPNWTIGIRTPWTISSERVWKKTHQLGEPLFKLSAIMALAGLLVPDYAVWFLIAPVLASSLGLVVYSYALYERGLKKK